MAQARYYLSALSPNVTTYPTGFLGTWGDKTSTDIGSNGGYLGPTMGVSEVVHPIAAHNANGITVALFAFYTDKLSAQTIPAGNWTFYGAGRTFAATAWTPEIFIGLVNGSNGTLRTTIAATQGVGATNRPTNAETSIYTATAAGSVATVTANDYLVFEYGYTSNSSTTDTWEFYTNGTTTVATDNIVTSDVASYLLTPVIWQQFIDPMSTYPPDHWQRPEVVGY